MSQFGSISALNLSSQNNVINFCNPQSTLRYSSYSHRVQKQIDALSFGASGSMGMKFKHTTAHAVGNRQRKGIRPFQVVCVDYPRPDLDSTINFLEAGQFSSSFRASPRPDKPLKIVIAGADSIFSQKFPFATCVCTLRAQTLFHSNTFEFGVDNKRWELKRRNLFQFSKMGKNNRIGGIELKKQKVVVIRAVATLESKSSTAQVDGERSNKLESGVGSGSVSGGGFDELAYSSGEESEELDEKEKLRRMRISKANKGNTPWNLGRKHSPETLKRIRERTRIAMQSPKVKMKLATLGHAQSEETKLKIGVGVRAGWERRRERLRLQETCYFEWQNLIAEACRKGSVSERELQWDSYKVLDKELEQEWLQSVEQRKNTPRPKGNKRAPKSPEQRRKISEAISAKWADAEYRERVCSALSKYYGTPEEGRKPRRRASCEREPKVRTSRKKKVKETAEKANSSGKSSIKKRSKMPKFKDPLASSKLEMIKNIRAQRAVVELKKTEAFKQAKELIREAERAAKALEANATRSPLAQVSLIESRELIAQAIQSLNSIENGHVYVFDENDINPIMDLEKNANDASETDHGVAVNSFGKSNLTSLINVNRRDEASAAALDWENRFIVNGLSCDFEDDSEDDIEEEQYATAFTGEQLRDQLVRLNGKINSNALFQNRTQVVHSSDNDDDEEEGNSRTQCSETGTKKWVRGKLVNISEGND